MKLFVTAFTTLLLTAGMAYAEDLERPREGRKSGAVFHEWMTPPAPIEDTGDAIRVAQPVPMEIQLLSGPSILPFGALLLSLGAGQLVGRGSDGRLRATATPGRGRQCGSSASPRPGATR